jgi:hypothetical protein
VFSKGNVTQTSYPMTRDFLYQEALKAAEVAPRRFGHG